MMIMHFEVFFTNLSLGSTFTVMRTHGEFEWLFSSLAENPKYWGFIIPVSASSSPEK